MIIDKLSNSNLYSGFGKRINDALAYLIKTDFSKLKSGKYEIDADNIFALVSEYKTKDETEGKPEAHKKYIDVQFVAKGSELIGYVPLENQKIISEYNEQNDIIFFEGEKSFIKIDEGMFAIFFPNDIHMPGIKFKEKAFVKKVVVKVKV
ncbi:MAG: YhcH/YjgK/YiaL family protein [Ignavibacteriaceae bacterium]|jgi:YhcH/YjgK/YiaL family protein|nr:YhcH/YjgK/YiaL family protein [Ignavibacteriaceae bacterium]